MAKKHLRRAVQRNRIKRLVRESFRRHRSELAGLDIVVLVRPGIAEADNTTLLAALDHHWERLRRDAAA